MATPSPYALGPRTGTDGAEVSDQRRSSSNSLEDATLMRDESHSSLVLPGHRIRGLRGRSGSGDLARRSNLDSQPFRHRTTARDDPAGHGNFPGGAVAN